VKISAFLKRTSAFLAVLLVVGLTVPSLSAWIKQHQEAEFAAQVEDSWGSEVLASVGEGLQQMSPIMPANACGLGASSCFRCHNGQRAKEPVRTETFTWHTDHDKVNHSCVGCHNGNPRILKQNLAHKDLIGNPLTAPEKTCASCHSADELSGKLKNYTDKHPSFIQ
jgi:hypothetical protein